MKHLRHLALAAAALIAGATAASAQQAYTTGDVNMRAGPGSRYPVVTTIPEDSSVDIHGCLSDWDWCDVSWRRNRGWVFSDYLEAMYRNRRIGFDEYRGNAGIPLVTFGFGYWDRWYRDRPWYDDWDHWGGDRWRDRDRHHRNGDWDRNRDDDGNGDGNGSIIRRNRNGDSRITGGNDNDDDPGMTNPDEGRGKNDRAPRRCGTPGADPSCPDASHGRRLQQQQDNQP